MGKSDRRVITFVCDRCGFELSGDTLRAEEAANCGPSSREFWVVKSTVENKWQQMSDPQYPMKYLCAPCANLHRDFMAGRKLVREDG